MFVLSLSIVITKKEKSLHLSPSCKSIFGDVGKKLLLHCCFTFRLSDYYHRVFDWTIFWISNRWRTKQKSIFYLQEYKIQRLSNQRILSCNFCGYSLCKWFIRIYRHKTGSKLTSVTNFKYSEWYYVLRTPSSSFSHFKFSCATKDSWAYWVLVRHNEDIPDPIKPLT